VRRAAAILPPLGTLAVFLAAWQAAIAVFRLPPFLVPSPWAVAHQAWASRQDLFMAGVTTLAGALCGFFAALAGGTLGALLFSQARWIRSSLFPYAIFLQTVPIVAVAPLIVIWFGAGFSSIVLVAFVLSVFPILSNGVEGMTRVDPQLLELFSLHNASPFQILFKLRLPHSVPYLVAGAKVASGLAVIGAIVGEFSAGYGAARPGLGYLILQSSGQLRTDLLFACVASSTLLGLSVFVATGLAARAILERIVEPGSA